MATASQCHASSESYKRNLAMAAEYIGGRPRQSQYGTNLAIKPRPGVGWACPGRFNFGNFFPVLLAILPAVFCLVFNLEYNTGLICSTFLF